MPRMTASEAGRLGGLKGGKSKSAAKLAAAKRNGFQPRAKAAPAEAKPDTVEKLRRICTVVPAPSNRKPPAPVPDEFSQEEPNYDMPE